MAAEDVAISPSTLDNNSDTSTAEAHFLDEIVRVFIRDLISEYLDSILTTLPCDLFHHDEPGWQAFQARQKALLNSQWNAVNALRSTCRQWENTTTSILFALFGDLEGGDIADRAAPLKRLQEFSKHSASQWYYWPTESNPTPPTSTEPEANRRFQDIYLRLRRCGTYLGNAEWSWKKEVNRPIPIWTLPEAKSSNDDFCDAVMWRVFQRIARQTIYKILNDAFANLGILYLCLSFILKAEMEQPPLQAIFDGHASTMKSFIKRYGEAWNELYISYPSTYLPCRGFSLEMMWREHRSEVEDHILSDRIRLHVKAAGMTAMIHDEIAKAEADNNNHHRPIVENIHRIFNDLQSIFDPKCPDGFLEEWFMSRSLAIAEPAEERLKPLRYQRAA